MNADPAYQRALEAQRAGRLDDALALYREVIGRAPTDAVALYNAGVVCLARHEDDAARDYFAKALAQDPARPAFRIGYAECLIRLDRLDEAGRQLDRALDIEPTNAEALLKRARLRARRNTPAAALDDIEAALAAAPERADAWRLKGQALNDLKRYDEAIAAFEGALSRRPEWTAAGLDLANALDRAGRAAEARDRRRHLVERDPKHEGARLALARSLRQQGDGVGALAVLAPIVRADEAREAVLIQLAAAHGAAGDVMAARDAYGRILARNPRHGDALAGLARIEENAHNDEEAIRLWSEAVTAKPDDVLTRFNLGNALGRARHFQRAIDEYENILAVDPRHIPSLVNMANMVSHKGRMPEALELFERVLALRPAFGEIRSNLGNLYKDLGRAEEALAHYRRAIEQSPDFTPAQNNLLMALHYVADVAPETIYAEHVERGRAIAGAAAVPPPPAGVERDPARRLRIGYVSPDFRTHPVAYFIEPVLRAHDRAKVEVFAYHASGAPDETTARLKSLVDGWRELRHVDDEAAAATIRDDRIDVLVDLAGHTSNNRLGLFARRPAPVQATWLGYPDTTGIPAILYRLTDAVADPPETADRLASERLVRLPHGFHCYRPPEDAPAVGPQPLDANGYVTFGSFNNMAKTTPRVIATWSAVLRAVADSRLVIKSRIFADDGTAAYFRDAFAAHGIDAGRLELIRPVPSRAEHLGHYNGVDIAFDTFPYNGTTTTCEALYMGVPVVTFAGPIHVARVGASLLASYGSPELIAEDEAGYVALAVALAGDRSRLAGLRRDLRGRVTGAPASNPATFTAALEDAYREMWTRFCADGT